MKSGNRILLAAGLLLGGTVIIRAALEPWVQHTPSGTIITAFFRGVTMPGGAVLVRRPPSETRPALTNLIAKSARDAALYRLRASEAELALDFTAAEADWKTFAQTASDRYAAQLELADFYHRRIRPRDELAALTAAASAPDDPLQPAAVQRGWRAYERMAALIEQESLPEAVAEPVFRAWTTRYPKEPAAARKLIEHLTSAKRYDVAEREIAAYGKTYQDEREPVKLRADLEIKRGSSAAAIAVYDRAFQPLWPAYMRAAYFKLLTGEGQLRDFAGRARSALAKNHTDLDATARLFHYFAAQNNNPAARRTLLEYRLAKESSRQPWTAAELQTLAKLFELVPDVNEAARLYYALYSIPPANGPQVEEALYRLALLLLNSSGEPIQFGSGDLSFYQDIASVDPSPGFLNGILSLVLNGSGPRWEYEQQNEKASAYFHRAAAARLTALLEQRFPQSTHRAALRAGLVSAYATYGDDASVIRAGREYLAAFPKGGERVSVASEVCDALARGNRSAEEFAVYDQLLRELSAQASGVPVGANPQPNPQPDAPVRRVRARYRREAENDAPSTARSAEYVQVLDKYLSRLAELKRPLDALRVYRVEIDRNPNDPGLYQRLASFVEQNGMSREVEDVYTKAIARFGERSWYHKLARWYLRQKQSTALEKISRDAIAVFTGAELESYFSDIVSQTHPDAALYRQLNVYAHERFPADMVFVHNLINAYARKETYDAAAGERLLRQYWFYDPQLKSALFERLSERGRLYPELSEIRAANPALVNGQYEQALAANPAAVQFAAEAEVWLGHYEAAAPIARVLANVYPGRREFAGKASALYRSLAAYYPQDTDVAVSLAALEQRADPRDASVLARMGDICADRELFGAARAHWEKMAEAQPGKPEAYLDAATVYWDYYRFDDALRWITTARKRFADPALYAYQAGAIFEAKREDRNAIREYLSGALAGDDADERRLIRLASFTRTRDLVERATAGAVTASPSPRAVSLRISVLETQQRRADIELLLRSRVESEKVAADLTNWQETARRLGFDAIEQRASERLAAVTNDPVDKLRLTLATVRLHEAKQDIAGAAAIVDGLLRDHPLILGVLRAAVDFHVRNHQPTEAIAILTDASQRARADLGAKFELEAARIATQAGLFDRARSLLAKLLAAEPIRAEYLAAMADTYLQANDDSGFRDYQLATLQQLKQSKLTARERLSRIAGIRRALIPALDRLKDTAGAVDQYIEVVNSDPEDEDLTKEAATYAVKHGQAARIVAYYRKTIAAAPLDYRWPIVLGRIETTTEDYPAAIADYERGIKARPDRAGLLQAKGHLEERILRFDDAIKTYSRLYELAYRDPQWMRKVAELHARSQHPNDAVSALKLAVIGARNETAGADFEIAQQLESWHILSDAVAFAERGAKLAGANLQERPERAAVYARIMAKARRTDEVLATVGAESSGGHRAAQAAGAVVAETYTPEEKTHFEQALQTQANRIGRSARDSALLPLAAACGMVELEARWRLESMTAQNSKVDERLVSLEWERGAYADIGRQLETYGAQHPGLAVEASAYARAAQSFIAEGDMASQLRVMRKMIAGNQLSGTLLDRYLSFAAARYPDELLAVVRGNPSADIRNRAVQFAIAAGRPELAYSAVRDRGTAINAVWGNAYTALAGLYRNDRAPVVDAAFQSALDTRTIGERLKTPLTPGSVVVGNVWFYYASRYGDYLAEGKSAAAGAWLPAYVEGGPAQTGAYLALGDAYAEHGQMAKAIVEYEHAIALDPDRGDAHDHIARLLSKAGRTTEALAHWKSALGAFRRVQSRGVKVPESFWGRVIETFTDIGERHVFAELHGEIIDLLGDYYERNGDYRMSELTEAASRAGVVSGYGTAWLVDFGRATGSAGRLLRELMETEGLTEAQRVSLQREVIAAHAKAVEGSFGYDREYKLTELARARWELTSMLLDAGDIKGAQVEWGRVAAPTGRRSRWDQWQARDKVEIRLAAKAGTLATLLERYDGEPDAAPSPETIREAALDLRRSGDEDGARTVLEFLYEQALSRGELEAANFLGLAEVKLQRNDLAAALSLLNRMSLVIEDGFETLMPASELLTKYGHKSEAGVFLRRRVKAVPWDAEARLKLALTLAAGTERQHLLSGALADPQASYKLRAEAACMATSSAPGTELALLASPRISLEAASKPYQLEARAAAATTATSPEIQLRLWREALALAPADERARIGAVRAALALRRDALALALAPSNAQSEPPWDYAETPSAGRRRYFRPSRSRDIANVAPRFQLTDLERGSLSEQLAAAAERLDDMIAAQRLLRAAISLRPVAERGPLTRHLQALEAEQDRRTRNAARQPVIKNVIEQDQIVRPQIARSAQ